METPETDSFELDLREEYANAFRTESYIDFWTSVISLSDVTASAAKSKSISSSTTTAAARLPSYRLFAEHLLKPDQPTVIRILSLAQIQPKNHSLLLDYFFETSNASILCGILLKDIDHVRSRYKSLKLILKTLELPSQINHLPMILTHLTEYCHASNPFIKSASSPHNIQTLQTSCFDLLKRLEFSRNKSRAKLRKLNKIKLGSAIILITLTASLTIIIVAHAPILFMATPSIVFTVASIKRLARWSTQVDVAAKGTYILSRDLDTISRLVARLSDELEHNQKIVKFWLEKGENQHQSTIEVARQLKKNDSSFCSQLDELEEHLYLCFMTVNRSRNLVIKEFNDPNTT